MKASRFRALAAAAAAGGMLAAAGCGNLTATQGPVAGSSDRPHLTQSDFVPVVMAATRAAGSVHIVQKVTDGGKDNPTTVTTTGDLSYARQPLARVTVDEPELRSNAPSSADKIEVRLVGGGYYLYLPGRVPVGKFLKVGKDFRTSALGGFCTCVLGPLDPIGRLVSMGRALRSVEYVGMEASGGLYLDHYRVDIDPVKMFGAAAAAAKGEPGTLHYQIWLDSGHLIRKLLVERPGVKTDITMDDWGKRVEVDRPALKQVAHTKV